jgi:hypothetical protein
MSLLYFHLLPAPLFHDILRPALTESWLRRNFAPCVQILDELRRAGTELPNDCLLIGLANLPFSRHSWRSVVGECLLFGSVDLPRLQTAPETLYCLLAPETPRAADLPRARYAPIQQAHLGSRDLHCGGYYRPEHAGYNDRTDVTRLTAYLRGQDPTWWHADALTALPELASAEDREEELAYVRDRWPALVALYERAHRDVLLVVCEEM